MNTAMTRTGVSSERPLPEGWRWVRLGDVCEIVSGSTPSTSVPGYWDGDIPWVTPTDLGKLSSPILTATQRSITKAGLANCAARMVSSGTVLMSSRAPIGHLAVAGVPCCTNQGCKNLVPSESVDTWYLFFALKLAVPELKALGSGVTFTEISKTSVESFAISLPPLAEQRRIAAILSEQMSAVERARAAAEARLEAAKALPAAYLSTVFDSPEAQQWPRRRLGEVALLVQNGIYKSAENYGHGHPFLRMYNVQNDSWQLSFKTLAQVELQGGETETFGLKLGDLLISRVNSFELVGKCAWVGPEAAGYVFENMLIRVRLGDSVDSLFVAQQMSIPVVREQIERVAKRAIGQASINSEDLRSIQIALPKLAEQRRIAAILSGQTAAVEHLCKALQEELATINKLPAALLRRAFAGEL